MQAKKQKSIISNLNNTTFIGNLSTDRFIDEIGRKSNNLVDYCKTDYMKLLNVKQCLESYIKMIKKIQGKESNDTIPCFKYDYLGACPVERHKQNYMKMRCTVDEFEQGMNLLKSSNPGVLIDKFNIEITCSSLRCLLPGLWLTDEVINFYLGMLQERSDRLSDNESKLSCFFFNTYFFEKLTGGDYDDINYDYRSVSRWTKKKKCRYIF